MCNCKGGGKNPLNNTDIQGYKDKAKHISAMIENEVISELPQSTIQEMYELYKQIYPKSNGLPTLVSLVQQLKDIGNGTT